MRNTMPPGINSALSNLTAQGIHVGAKDLSRIQDGESNYFEHINIDAHNLTTQNLNSNYH